MHFISKSLYLCILKDEDTLGIKTNARSTNWYAFVGDEEKGIIVAGCQIHYACICNNKPCTDPTDEQRFVESKGELVRGERDIIIYLAQ